MTLNNKAGSLLAGTKSDPLTPTAGALPAMSAISISPKPGSLSAILEETFTRQSTDERVAVAHGYGIQLRIKDGQLVLRDGIGRHQRERTYSKADRMLQRIVITGQTGFITLESLAWCREHGIAITALDLDGELVSAYSADGISRSNVILARRQSQSDPGHAVEITRELLTAKLHGQSKNLTGLLSDLRAASRVDSYAKEMLIATEMRELNDLERWAAKVYFEAWATANVSVPWSDSETRIPDNWRIFPRRSMTASRANTKRHASDPVNAMLNWAYTIGYAEARIACASYALDPRLGFNHADSDKRDSFALDILETARPEIDAYILGLLGFGSEPRRFSRRDFYEPFTDYPHGTVRLTAPLTHEIVEHSLCWQKTLSSAAETVVMILSSTSGRRGIHSMALKDQRAAFVSQPVDVNSIITDQDWSRLESLLPPKAGMDYSSISNRVVFAALVFLERHHKPLAYIPAGFGVSRRTLHERRLRWTRSGHWPEIERAIRDLAASS